MDAIRVHRNSAEECADAAKRSLAFIRRAKRKRKGGRGGDEREAVTEMIHACVCCQLAAEHYHAAREHALNVDQDDARDELNAVKAASSAACRAAQEAATAVGMADIVGAIGRQGLDLHPGNADYPTLAAHREMWERRRKAWRGRGRGRGM